MDAKQEAQAIIIHRELLDLGYLIDRAGGLWKITEPESRDMPQSANLRTMAECDAWRGGVEAIRSIAPGIYGSAKRNATQKGE